MAQQAADVVEHDGSHSHRAATVRAVDGRSLALRWLRGCAAGQPKAPAQVQPHQPLDQLMAVSGTGKGPLGGGGGTAISTAAMRALRIVVFVIEQKRDSLRCPCCDSANVHKRGSKLRRFRILPIGRKPAFVELNVARVSCSKCGIVRQVKVEFADTQRTYSRAFAQYVLGLRRSMTLKDVAHHVKVSQWMVRDIEKLHLKKHYAKPKLKWLSRIAIDEISVGSGYRYLTIVLDLDSGVVVFVGNGKKAESLKPF